MYKVVFFKFFLFVLYATAGFMSKMAGFVSNGGLNEEIIYTGNINTADMSVGSATVWLNPFVTRFKVPTTITTTSTTTTTAKRTLRPRTPRILFNRIAK
jgi:hypothetical protein